MCSLPRLWSSWIPNFSRWLTWLKPTGSNGRSWIGRDNMTTARLPWRAPAVLLTAQKQAAAAWPKQATRPAAATTNHPRTLVSFWRSSVRLFFASPPLLDEACHGGSACRGSRAALLLRLGFCDLSTATSDKFSCSFQPSPCRRMTELCSACLSNNYRSADAVRWQTQNTVSTCQPLS